MAMVTKTTKNLNGVCDFSCFAPKPNVHLAHISACVLHKTHDDHDKSHDKKHDDDDKKPDDDDIKIR